MNKQLFIVAVLGLMAVFCQQPHAVGQDGNGTIDFVNDIQPILENNCVRCHGAVDAEGGYRIDIADEALEYIEAGDPDNSDLYSYLISEEEDEMMPPPDDGGPLGDSDIQMIRTWIEEGANWPTGVTLTAPSDGDPVGDDVESTSDNDDGTTDDDSTDEPKNVPPPKFEPDPWKAIGSLHPAAIHLPIGLLMAAGLFALLSLRGNFVMSDCAYYCLWLGTLGAIGACATGWWFTLSERPRETVTAFGELMNMDHKLFWHRSSALVATVFALLLSLFAASARNKDPNEGVAWKLGVILLAMGIGFVGHQGGELTWRSSHYKDLNAIIEGIFPGLGLNDDENGAPPNQDVGNEPSADTTKDDESSDATGETSASDDVET